MGICQCACHPFEYGRFLFMHNGQVAGFKKIRRHLMSNLSQSAFDYAIANSASDSSLAFAIFIDQVGDANAAVSPARLRQCLVNVISIIGEALVKFEIKGTSLLNFVVSDGSSMVATRYVINPDQDVPAASLYFSSGTSFEPSVLHEEVDSSELEPGKGMSALETVKEYKMTHEDRRDNVVIVTSEPLTNVVADWVLSCLSPCRNVAVRCCQYDTPWPDTVRGFVGCSTKELSRSGHATQADSPLPGVCWRRGCRVRARRHRWERQRDRKVSHRRRPDTRARIVWPRPGTCHPAAASFISRSY
mgnify:CR=1 FL=1